MGVGTGNELDFGPGTYTAADIPTLTLPNLITLAMPIKYRDYDSGNTSLLEGRLEYGRRYTPRRMCDTWSSDLGTQINKYHTRRE